MTMFDDAYKIELIKKYPIPYFSYSQLNSFLQCPHSYYLTYMTGRFESNGNKYTKLGNVLHDIFEQEGKQKVFGEKDKFLTKGQAIKRFNKDFMAVKNEHKEYFTDKEDFIKMYQKGITALENYYEMYVDSTPLFVERKFQNVIAEGLPPSKAFIDRIDGDKDDASTWIISDYKTGGAPKPKDYLRKDIQMALYVLQVYAEFGKYPKAVQFVHPVPNKIQTALHQGDGVYKFQGQRAPVVEFNVADTIIFVRDTIAKIVETIESEGWKKQVDSWNCKMCFHFVSGKCKPFDTQQQGWTNI